MKSITGTEYGILVADLKMKLRRYTINHLLGALAEVISEGAATEDSNRLKVATRLLKMAQTAEVKALS